MAENHLEYGYLEGEPIGEHFAEDPVGIIMFVADRKAAVTFGRGDARRRGERRLSRWTNKRRKELCYVVSSYH